MTEHLVHKGSGDLGTPRGFPSLKVAWQQFFGKLVLPNLSVAVNEHLIKLYL